jgi:GNAT superfamily N-acetyltransferase
VRGFLLLIPEYTPPRAERSRLAAHVADLSRIGDHHGSVPDGPDRVHGWLARKSYWTGEMPRRVFDRALREPLCFAAIKMGATVGFARVISDRATFAYVLDVFVDPAHRGTGISKAVMAAVVAHPELQDLRLWVLATADAHGLYARYGFTSLVS